MKEGGREIDNTTLETNGRLLVKYLRGIEGVKKLTFEECELSNWLYEILRPEVEELIVCNPVANKDYRKVKTDKMDARKLAKLLRGGQRGINGWSKFNNKISGHPALVLHLLNKPLPQLFNDCNELLSLH